MAGRVDDLEVPAGEGQDIALVNDVRSLRRSHRAEGAEVLEDADGLVAVEPVQVVVLYVAHVEALVEQLGLDRKGLFQPVDEYPRRRLLEQERHGAHVVGVRVREHDGVDVSRRDAVFGEELPDLLVALGEPAAGVDEDGAAGVLQHVAVGGGRPHVFVRLVGVDCRRGHPVLTQPHHTGDYLLHDLVGAAAYRHQPDVAVRAGDIVLFHEAVAAVDLQAGIDHFARHPRAEQLGHRDFLDRVLAVHVEPERVVGERAPGLDLGLHVREVVGDDLEVGYRLAERLALLRVLEGLVEGLLRPADRAERERQPLPGEHAHDLVETAVELAEQRVAGDDHVRESQLAGAGSAPAQLVQLARDLEPRGAGVHHEHRDAAITFLRVGLRREDHEVAARAVGYARLRAVYHPFFPVFQRFCLDGGDVAAGVRLGDRQAADPLALDARDEVLLFLLVGPVVEYVRHRDRDVRSDVRPDAARAALAHRFVEDSLRQHVITAAVLLRVSHPQVAQAAHLLERRARNLSRFLPLVGVGSELVEDEIGDALAEHLVLGLEQVAAHRYPPYARAPQPALHGYD